MHVVEGEFLHYFEYLQAHSILNAKRFDKKEKDMKSNYSSDETELGMRSKQCLSAE